MVENEGQNTEEESEGEEKIDLTYTHMRTLELDCYCTVDGWMCGGGGGGGSSRGRGGGSYNLIWI